MGFIDFSCSPTCVRNIKRNLYGFPKTRYLTGLRLAFIQQSLLCFGKELSAEFQDFESKKTVFSSPAGQGVQDETQEKINWRYEIESNYRKLE